jgi:drug/metabolite transporter (DMT)-like permease
MHASATHFQHKTACHSNGLWCKAAFARKVTIPCARGHQPRRRLSSLALPKQTRHHQPMRLFLLTALTMIAFAGNSLLNRMAIVDAAADPAAFAFVRVVAGAVTLALLLALRGGSRPPRPGRNTLPAVLGLTAYLVAFSVAYVGLAAGSGALILFGTVQITMFAGALVLGQRLAPLRIGGAGLAFAGLAVLLWPGAGDAITPLAGLIMVVAGIGWGVYSLAGAGSTDALAGTAVNFVLAVPLVALFWWLAGAAGLSGLGLALALVSGAVTSGLGYALWYAILPALGAQRAAVAQLTVPVIAAAAGAALLGEGLGWRFTLAALLVLGGVALASLRHRAA